MADRVLPVLCFLLATGHLSAGKLVLDVEPDTISPGLTSDLTVICSFIYNNQPNISTINSLTISKAESSNSKEGPFTAIFSINALTNQINHKGSTNAITSGNIDSNTLDAFLSLSWSSPSQAESGFYRCDANVMDEFGHPFNISTSAEVTSSKPDLDALIGVVGKLQADLALVKSELNIQVQTNAALNSTIAVQSATITDQNATILALQQNFQDQQLKNNVQLTDLHRQLDQQVSDLQEAVFLKSKPYNGHYYLLPGIMVTHINLAEYLCNRSRGYLMEIEDASEFQFIVNFLDSQAWRPPFMVGATKNEQSGQWVFRHSGRPVTFFKWGTGQPTNTGNCMTVYHGVSWEMADITCGLVGTYSFLCEVPES